MHPLKVQAAIVRAANSEAEGRHEAAEVDLARAAALAAGDPDVTRNIAAFRMAAGDDDGALRVLMGSAADDDSLLLAIRAQVRLRLGDRSGAEGDIDAALRRLAEAGDGDATRMAMADVALDLGRSEQAAELLGSLTPAADAAAMRWVLAGRQAFVEGRIADAVVHYREAAGRSAAFGAECLTELATRLVVARDDERALEVFAELGDAPLPDEPRRAKVQALMRVRRFEAAQAEIDRIAATGPLPAWALGTAVDIALERDDPRAAIDHLTELVERGQSTPQNSACSLP